MVSEEQQSDMELAAEMVPVPQIQYSTEEPTLKKIDQMDVSKRKPRLRKKALHAAILKQMEFYFGDANLSRDRFLANLIKEDPHIHLSVFLQFNKIRALTNDTNRIAKALQASSLLAVSEDGTKVWRVTPISQKENSDECTIYVQKLPPNADHDWLNTIFSQYGPTDYISVPRYTNKKIKGFAFVEFKAAESAKRCLEAFREKGCVLPSQTSPDKLLSITTYDKEDQTEVEMEKEDTLDETHYTEDSKYRMEVQTKKSNDNTVQSTEPSKTEKRKKRESSTPDKSIEQDNEESKKSKKRKLGESECTEEHDQRDLKTELKLAKELKKAKKQKHKNRMQNMNLEESDRADTETKNEGKLREQNYAELETCNDKEKETENNIVDLDKDEEQKVVALEVFKNDNSGSSVQNVKRSISESEVEKNKKFKKRKQMIVDTSKESSENDVKSEQNVEMKDKTEDLTTVEEKMTEEKLNGKKGRRKRQNRSDNKDMFDIRLQVMAKNDWKKLRNKYLELQKSKMKLLKQHLRRAGWSHDKNSKVEKRNIQESDRESEKKSTPKFTLIPGTIVKIKLDKPCMDSKSFKMELRGNTDIKYIDVSEGSIEAFVRCDTTETANALVQNSVEGRHMSILQGEEEKIYHDKILSNREEKLNKKVRIKQRGRDKLLKKAEKELGKHIKFDEV